jgi:hypothetical protein
LQLGSLPFGFGLYARWGAGALLLSLILVSTIAVRRRDALSSTGNSTSTRVTSGAAAKKHAKHARAGNRLTSSRTAR